MSQAPQYPPNAPPPGQYPPPYAYNPNYPPGPGGYYPPPVPVKKKGGCGGCLIALLIGLVLVGALGVGAYLAFKNGAISQHQLLALAGQAPAEINIINFGEKTLAVRLIQLDNSDPDTTTDELIKIEPLGMDGFSIQPGRYRVEMVVPGELSLRCTLRAASGEFIQFNAIANAILVSSDQNPARTSSDLRVPGSPLCQK